MEGKKALCQQHIWNLYKLKWHYLQYITFNFDFNKLNIDITNSSWLGKGFGFDKKKVKIIYCIYLGIKPDICYTLYSSLSFI